MSRPIKRQDTVQPRDVASVMQALQIRATPATPAGMARYATPATNALGVAMRDEQALAKTLGKDHALADALWRDGRYEARLLAINRSVKTML